MGIEPTSIALIGLLGLQAPEAAHSAPASAPPSEAADQADPALDPGDASPEINPSDVPPGRHAVAPRPAPGPAPRRGTGMIVMGSLVGVFGPPLVVTAAIMFAEHARCERSDRDECWAGLGGAIMMPIGVVALAVGVPLLGAGIHRRRAWRAWQDERGLAMRPQLGRSRGAWTLGLELRF